LNIIYISYWGINDGLTESTVLPHLKLLEEDSRVKNVFFFTFERSTFQFISSLSKVKHFPIVEKHFPPGLNKFLSYRNGWIQLKKLVNTTPIDLVICRSIFAGIYGHKLFKIKAIPFIVESYEPHVDYMEESGEWKPNGLKSKIIRKYDELIRKSAFKLFPVSNHYAEKLQKEGLDKTRLAVIPCSVDIQRFQFSQDIRSKIRKEIVIKDEINVGIYVGKFGGIYLKEEAFKLFKSTYEAYESNFFLIIISPEKKEEILTQLVAVNFPIEKVYINRVDHKEVPNYLSASDFAFSTIKPAPSRSYCSPIKDGEYWANGLPILITKGVGDDDEIISENEIGVVYDVTTENPKSASKKMIDFMLCFDRNNENQRKKIVEIAKKHRSFEINKTIYTDLLNSIDKNDKP
jgi:glycosyltransferase involved in cell wall biosynthesis